MTAVISQLSVMVLMIVVGYICAKVNITGPEFNRYTSPVLTNVLLPATILKSMTGIGTDIEIVELLYVIALFFLMMGIAGLVGYVFSKVLRIEDDQRGVLLSIVMYMNLAFVGFPLVESYYGSEGMLYACLSCAPMNLLMFSVGVVSISGNREDGMKVKQFLNLPLVATLLGLVLMLLHISLPNAMTGTINSLAGATIPVSMIILGSSLAAIPVKGAFDDFRVYIASVARLIVCPLITYFILNLFVENRTLIGTITILASTPVAVLITPLCVQYGKDDQLSSKSIFISTVLSIITMPLIIWSIL